jgi:hypothetical protein
MLQSCRPQSAPKQQHAGAPPPRHGSLKTWEFTRRPAPVGRDYRRTVLGSARRNKPFFKLGGRHVLPSAGRERNVAGYHVPLRGPLAADVVSYATRFRAAFR